MQKYVLLLAFLWLFVACGPTSKSNESPKPEFSLEPVETKLELSAGGESTTIINLKRNTGFEDNVIMRFEGLPEGVEQVWSRDTENGDCL